MKNVTDEFKNKTVPAFYDVLAQYYSERDGPYLLGSKATYADFAVYQSIDNNEKVGSLPVSLSSHLNLNYRTKGISTDNQLVKATLPGPIAKFREAFEARPRVAAYLASGRKTNDDAEKL